MSEVLKYSIEVDDKGAAKSINKVGKKIDGLGDKTQKTTNSMKSSFGGLKNVVGAMGLASAGMAIFQLGKSAVTAGAEMEQTRIAFQTMFGGVEAGNKQLDKFIDFANVTPYVTKEVVSAGQALAAGGLRGEELMKTLTQVGDIAAATGKPFVDFAQIVAKSLTKGKVQQETFNQFLERNVPITEAIGLAMGKTSAEIMKMGSAGLITGKELKLGLSAISEGFTDSAGNFVQMGGLMDKQSRSLTGKLSTLMGKWETLLARVGEGNQGALKDFLDWGIKVVDLIPLIDFSPIIGAFEAWGNVMTPIIDTISELFGLFGGDGMAGLDMFQLAITGIGIALRVIIGPFLIIGGLIVAIIRNLVLMATNFNLLADSIMSVGKALVSLSTGDFDGMFKNLGDAKDSYGEFFAESTGKAFGEFGSSVGDLFSFKGQTMAGKGTSPFDMVKGAMSNDPLSVGGNTLAKDLTATDLNKDKTKVAGDASENKVESKRGGNTTINIETLAEITVNSSVSEAMGDIIATVNMGLLEATNF